MNRPRRSPLARPPAATPARRPDVDADTVASPAPVVGPSRRQILGWTGAVTAAALCGLRVPLVHSAGTDRAAGVRRDPFGQAPGGADVHVYTLTNGRGLSARIMTFGATLMTVDAPDRHGKAEPLALHLDTLADYLKGHPMYGSTVGRFANRIAGAKFAIDGTEYPLDRNSGKNHIHGGGKAGFDKAVWKAEVVRTEGEAGAVGVRFTHVSPDGDGGYPGTLNATVTYSLASNDDRLTMAFEATTDKPTHVNLTNHAYWNLAGAGSGDVLKHVLRLHAHKYLPSDPDTKIPTGEIRDVAGTPMDFTEAKVVGSRIDQVEGRNYDHCYVLDGGAAGDKAVVDKPAAAADRPPSPRPAAEVYDPASGRTMDVLTTYPGVVMYTARGIGPNTRGGGGKAYGPYHGLCLECQRFPDAPNRPQFPSTLLRPGQTLREVTEHRFGVRPA